MPAAASSARIGVTNGRAGVILVPSPRYLGILYALVPAPSHNPTEAIGSSGYEIARVLAAAAINSITYIL